MRLFFLSGIILGLVVALSAARFYPWVDIPRATTRTVVLHNGGRVEDFMIRFPVDRIVSTGTAEMGLRAKKFPAGVELPEEMAGGPVLIEHFKLRDSQGDVIGLAARHTSVVENEATTAWALTIPSRGTMHLLGATEPRALDRELAAAGRIDGVAWNGSLELSIGSQEAGSGRIAGGSQEFASVGGTYEEVWLVSGVSQAGDVRGTIRLHTIARNSE